MSLPIQVTGIAEDRRATAAYNFVPIADQVVPAQSASSEFTWYNPDLYTGIISCKLTTLTPLYTRAALEKSEYEPEEIGTSKKEQKDKTEFFYIDPDTKNPVIPGSSLRGMFRSLFEIISFGKLQPVTDRQLVFRTLDPSSIGKAYGRRMSGGEPNQSGYFPLANAGYMELRNGTYFIRPARTIYGTQHYRAEEQTARRIFPNLQAMSTQSGNGRYSPNRSYKWMRRPIWFRPTQPTSHLPQSPTYYAEVTDISITKPSNPSGWEQGFFIASGWVPSQRGGKHRHWIVGPPTTNDSECIEIADQDITIYEEEGAGLTQKILNEEMSVLPAKEGNSIPCFYTFWEDSSGNKRVAFGHTAMFRLPYEYSPRDFLPPEHSARTLDMPEALFGWVDDAEKKQIAGRVRFTDAHVLDALDDLFLTGPESPPIRALLSSPKPTSFQHYLVQTTTNKQTLLNYQDHQETTLRGDKLYWHKGKSISKEMIHDPSVTEKQKTEFRPVKEGVRFEFSVRFENLTAEEVGALSWILQVAGNDQYALKLGMGKALGLGSVSISSSMFRDNRRNRYKHLFDKSGKFNHELEEINKDAYLAKFEQHVLTALGLQTASSSFSELPRIRMLLKLLEWQPSKDDNLSKTMELNSFRDRRVLPDPITATGGTLPFGYSTSSKSRQPKQARAESIFTSESPAPSKQRGSGISSQVIDTLAEGATKQETAVQQQAVQQDPVTPTSQEEIQLGGYLWATVTSSNFNGVMLEAGSTGIIGKLPQTEMTSEAGSNIAGKFIIGSRHALWVRDVNMKRKRLTFTMKAPNS